MAMDSEDVEQTILEGIRTRLRRFRIPSRWRFAFRWRFPVNWRIPLSWRLPLGWRRLGLAVLWALGWIGFAIGAIFALTAAGTALYYQRWASDLSMALGLAIALAILLVLASLLVLVAHTARSLGRIAQEGRRMGEEVRRQRYEFLRPLLVLPPPIANHESTPTRPSARSPGELETGPRLPGGQRWNPRILNIGAGPALNGEAWLTRQSTADGAIILTIEPLGSGQHVDLASLEMPAERMDDLELVLRYSDTFSRRFLTRYRLYASGQEGRVVYWAGEAEVETEEEKAL